MDDSPLFLAQNVRRALDQCARVIEAKLRLGMSLDANETRSLLSWIKDAQRDVAPLAYPKMAAVATDAAKDAAADAYHREVNDPRTQAALTMMDGGRK